MRSGFICFLLMAILSTTSIGRGQERFVPLRAFDGVDGRFPGARLLEVGGTLYGTTLDGGEYGWGNVFAIDRDGFELKSLHSFDVTDGARPWAGVTAIGSTLFGVTSSGGSAQGGTLFSIGMDGSRFRVLHDFGHGAGSAPYASLTNDGGTLYGVTTSGGTFNVGTIFSYRPDGSGVQVLHSFQSSEGYFPRGELLSVGDRLYGTMQGGGPSNGGSIFSIGKDGSDFAVIRSFAPFGGYSPQAGLSAIGSKLYGVTSNGGSSGRGTLFAMDTNGGNFQTLHEFSASINDGGTPLGNLLARDGRLLGTTTSGGANGAGTVFAIDPDGGNYETLYAFQTSDGYYSAAGLTASGASLYGTAMFSGAGQSGTVITNNLGRELSTEHHPVNSELTLEIFLGDPDGPSFQLGTVRPLNVEGTLNARMQLDAQGNGMLRVLLPDLALEEVTQEVINLGGLGTIQADIAGLTLDLEMLVPVVANQFQIDDAADFRLVIDQGNARFYNGTGLIRTLLIGDLSTDFRTNPLDLALSDLVGRGLGGTVDQGLGLLSPNAEINLSLNGVSFETFRLGTTSIYLRLQGDLHVAVPEVSSMALVGCLFSVGAVCYRKRRAA